MRNRKAMRLAAALLAASILGSCSGQDSGESVQGPDETELLALKGVDHLEELTRGKVVVLDFWAGWCPPCKASVPHVNKLYEKYKGRGVSVYGINLDTKNQETAARRAIKSWGIKYPVLLDSGAVAREFKVVGIPMLAVIDKDGTLKSTGHSVGEVEKALEALLSGT